MRWVKMDMGFLCELLGVRLTQKIICVPLISFCSSPVLKEVNRPLFANKSAEVGGQLIRT